MWGSNYVLLPAGHQRGAKAGVTMEFPVWEHIMKTCKSATSSEKTMWGSNYDSEFSIAVPKNFLKSKIFLKLNTPSSLKYAN